MNNQPNKYVSGQDKTNDKIAERLEVGFKIQVKHPFRTGIKGAIVSRTPRFKMAAWYVTIERAEYKITGFYKLDILTIFTTHRTITIPKW